MPERNRMHHKPHLERAHAGTPRVPHEMGEAIVRRRIPPVMQDFLARIPPLRFAALHRLVAQLPQPSGAMLRFLAASPAAVKMLDSGIFRQLYLET